MRVALVSTYPPARCGIGNYSQELRNALARQAPEVDVTVIAEHDPAATADRGVMRAWHRTGDWVADIAQAVAVAKPDVVHIQHEESILGQDRRMPQLLATLAARGIGSVVTLHTVHAGRRGGLFHRALAAACDRIVVHQRTGMATALDAHGVARAQVDVIPHGTPELALPARDQARAMLGLPLDAPIALFFGFIHMRKRVHVALAAFARVARRVPGARFVVAGQLRRNGIFDACYAAWLRHRMKAGLAEGWLDFRPGFVPIELKAAHYAAADVVVLPHDQPYGSASGVLHEALAARRPLLCTRGHKFAEAVEAVATAVPDAFPLPGDRFAWERGFERMLCSDERRARQLALLATLAEQTSWSRSAQHHAQVYRTAAWRA